MTGRLLLGCLALIILALAEANPEPRGRGRSKISKSEETAVSEEGQRKGKFFSLFNIVQFDNEGCRSTSTISGGGTGSTARNGTCYTMSECENKGGAASGSCAAGFGVCCVFLVSNAGGTVSENCTYIRNPGFPNAYSDTGSVQYTIHKCSNNVCKLRLDFESFTLLGTGNTQEVVLDPADGVTVTEAGGDCLDSFDVTTNTGQRIPTICGQNTGQHMYIDIGNQNSDTATFNFAFGGSATNRQWEIKVSQIACHSECSKSYMPPEGCLQWHTGLTGRMTTFNFLPTNDNHLQNQDYSVCIRQEEGMCCIQYLPCTDANSFSIDTMIASMAEQDSGCTTDYIGLSGASGQCTQGVSPVPVINKFCGTVFSPVAGAPGDPLNPHVPVCDCTKPFIIDVFTDNADDLGMVGTTAIANTAQSRGVCLTWTQIPCN